MGVAHKNIADECELAEIEFKCTKCRRSTAYKSREKSDILH